MSSDNIKEERKFVARAASRLGYWKAKCVRSGGTGEKLETASLSFLTNTLILFKSIGQIQPRTAVLDLAQTTFEDILPQEKVNKQSTPIPRFCQDLESIFLTSSLLKGQSAKSASYMKSNDLDQLPLGDNKISITYKWSRSSPISNDI